MKREPAELIVIENPVEESQKKEHQQQQVLDIVDYGGGAYEEEEEEDDYGYVDYTAEEERMAAQQGRVKGVHS